MGQLIIHGYSDDNVEVRGHASGEIGFYEQIVRFVAGEGNTALGIYVTHSDRIGWVIGTYMPDVVEDERVWNPPPATITTAAAHRTPYSPMLTVDLPDGAPVRCWVGDEERPIR